MGEHTTTAVSGTAGTWSNTGIRADAAGGWNERARSEADAG
ncbi:MULTISPECIES: hypothetical protein [Halorussus]|nr:MULTISPECIES: hypothetical protein [Halorussus]